MKKCHKYKGKKVNYSSRLYRFSDCQGILRDSAQLMQGGKKIQLIAVFTRFDYSGLIDFYNTTYHLRREQTPLP